MAFAKDDLNVRELLSRGLRGEGIPVAGWMRYLLAVILVGIGLAARFLLLPVDAGLGFITFYPAVIAVALLVGTGPAVLAIVLSAACADYFFLPPLAAFGVAGRQALAVTIFGLTGTLTCLLSHQIRSASRALRESEQRLRGLYEAPHIGIALTDMNGRYIQFNDAFRKICGYSDEELKALDYWALTPDKYREAEEQQLADLLTTGHYGPYEKEYIRKDGHRVPLQLNGALLKGPDGANYIWSIVEDITERKALERQLATESARNRLFLRTASDGVHILNCQGRIVEASDTFCMMLGYTRDEVIGMRPSQWDARFPADDAERTLGNLMAGGMRRFETLFRRKNGSTFEVEILADGFALDNEAYVFCSARDITEQRRLEKAVLEATDREQRRLGHDLHDGLGQELTGISILASAAAAAERKAARPGADAIAQIAELTGHAISSCRSIARGLSPLGYTNGNLIEALQEMVNVQRETFGADTRFETILGGELKLPADACDHLYRIAQESVTNARRHAHATLIQVTLDISPSIVRLEILDNGDGYVPPPADAPGIGLRIMRYRARMMGAQFSIGAGDHGGTAVACETPQPP